MTIATHTMNKVTLLSAGPGDLDLLTLRAAKALAAAPISSCSTISPMPISCRSRRMRA